MMRTATVLSVFTLLMQLALARADDAKVLEGTWLPTEGILAGEKTPDDFLKSVTLEIKGTNYTATVGELKEPGKFMFDDKKKPKTIDITPTDGPNKGKTMLAIYEVDGDTMRVCYALDRQTRPTEFASPKDSKVFLVTYKRKK